MGYRIAFLALVAAALVALLAAPGIVSTGPWALAAGPTPTPDGILARGKISHVIVIVMENRTFDNIFGGVASSSPAPYPGADSSVPPSVVPLMHSASFVGTSNTNNFYNTYECVANGGFSSTAWKGVATSPLPCSGWHFGKIANPFWFLTEKDRRVYWEIAHDYELGDAFFAPTATDSYPAHQYIVAGQSRDAIRVGNSVVHDTIADETYYGTTNNYPAGCADLGVHPSPPILVPALGPPSSPWASPTMRGTEGECYDVPTFAEILNQATHRRPGLITWQQFATVTAQPLPLHGEQPFNGFINIRNWWNHRWAPSGKYVLDVAKGGAMPNFSWVKPPCVDASDHPGTGDGGPSWVKDVINAVGSNEKQWDHSVIFVVWDDWGGLYDHVIPPSPRPWDNMGPGLRTPFLVISPYVARGSVAHGVADYGSVMRFVEDLFGTGRLGTLDAHAPDLTGYFDFSQLRTFEPVAAKPPITWEAACTKTPMPFVSPTPFRD